MIKQLFILTIIACAAPLYSGQPLPEDAPRITYIQIKDAQGHLYTINAGQVSVPTIEIGDIMRIGYDDIHGQHRQVIGELITIIYDNQN